MGGREKVVIFDKQEELVAGEIRKFFPEMPDNEVSFVISQWETIPFVQDGQMVGAALIKGCEFHCLTLPAFKLRRQQMRDFLKPLFDRFGMLTTRVEHSDIANQRFNKSFGFKRTWSDDRYHYFMMTELPFSKGAQTCQQ